MSEWDQRQLCPDGGCVGVIGPDGTCKVCGRVAPNWGDERTRGLVTPEDEGEDEAEDDEAYDDSDDGDDGDDSDDGADDDSDDDSDDTEGDPEGDDDGRHTASGGEWSTRTLCPDGGCVGVIGSDGRCKVCGRSAA